MKKLLSIAILAATLTSCSVTRGSLGHSIQTQVELRESNFKVIGSFTGVASAQCFFGIGVNQTDLYNRARADLSYKALPIGTSRALVNVTTDIQHSWYLLSG